MKPPEFGGMEFAVGTVTGIRAWMLTNEGKLRGVTYNYRWTAGENLADCRIVRHKDDCDRRAVGVYGVCTCDSTDFGCDDLVDPNCRCGFYSYYRDQPLAFGGVVAGVIEGYGKTTLGTKGFRCEKARVVALTLPPAAEGGTGYTGDEYGTWGMWFWSHGYQIAGQMPLTKETREVVAANYPDVPIYDNYDAMVAAHPADNPLGDES